MFLFKIALRYIVARKAHNAVNIISLISMLGVVVTTAALVCVLSVFNGFTGVIMSRLAILDPPIAITPVQGKVITNADSVLTAVRSLPHTRVAMPVVIDNALAIFADYQMPVRLKGVPDAYNTLTAIDSVMVDGDALVCRVGVVASEHPYVRISTDLKTWLKEEDGIPSSLATVTWSGSAGNWTCRIANNTGGTPFFANMQYMQEGGTKIVNSAALDVSAGILCTDGIHKVRPVYNSGTITWEVVQ